MAVEKHHNILLREINRITVISFHIIYDHRQESKFGLPPTDSNPRLPCLLIRSSRHHCIAAKMPILIPCVWFYVWEWVVSALTRRTTSWTTGAPDVRSIHLLQLIMTFERCYVLCVQKLYYKPIFAVGGGW